MENELIINPKTLFVEDVRKWAMIESQLKIVNEKTRKMRNMKNELSEKICKYIVDNKVSDNKVKISDGEIRVYDKKEYSPLTFGYIEKSLSNLISDKEKVEYIVAYLKENREITTSPDIKRTYNN
uniref:Uncharacterized protein n=1 Tax=viral metagenome TaxID=1070528 RepID=A0A6C0JGY7_9ZZZZ